MAYTGASTVTTRSMAQETVLYHKIFQCLLVFILNFRTERRRELGARYWFDCQCPACVKNWPLLTSLPKDPGVKDELIDDFIAKGQVSDALNLLIPKLCENSTWQEPSEEFIRLEDKLRTCINNFGNVVIPDK